MADARNQEKQIRKDQDTPVEVRNEVMEELGDDTGVKPLIRNPNRDVARGDWDRTGIHHDEGTSRVEE